MIRPVCVKCGVMYVVEKQGIVVADMAIFGVAELINADRLKCLGCGNEIIGKFADKPFTNHHEKSFPEKLKHAQEHGGIFLAFNYVFELAAWWGFTKNLTTIQHRRGIGLLNTSMSDC